MAGRLKRKRKLLDGEETDDYSGGIQDEISKFGQHSSSGRKHTMDSDEDEEDDDDYNKRKHNVMDEEEIEGQEDGTLDFDGETKITPFNMKDELEEGYFDGNGMYIWNKRDASEVKDSWLDSIDWMKVQPPKKGGKQKKKGDDEESSKEMDTREDEDEDIKDEPVNVLALYKQMLQLLKPRETVLKAIKRLGAEAGNKQLSASERLKQKKQAAKLAAANTENNGTSSTSTAAENAASTSATPQQEATDKVTKLTELADTILSATGNMDVYQETYESVTFKIKREESKKMLAVVNDDEDMFGDSFEAKKDDAVNDATESGVSGSITDASDEVKWEFKWEDKEDAAVYGPHTSTEMHSWVSEGYFKEGVFVRKYKQAGPFYTSKRVDFELYC